MTLSTVELDRLTNRIEEDYNGAVADHGRRMERFRGYYQKWRNRVDAPTIAQRGNPNFSVPLLQWQVFAKWAQTLDQLLGDDAEVIAVPTGPSDYRTVAKIARFMQWRAFESMDIMKPLAVFTFRQILFGRSIAWSPWVIDTYQTRKGEKIWYQGPGFTPLWPDDVIVPVEDAGSLHDFSWMIRRVSLTPQKLYLGEMEGRYSGIKANWERIVNLADQGEDRIDQEVKAEKDEGEGVTFEGSLNSRHTLEVHEWYGKHRPIKGGRPSFEEHELIAWSIPKLNLNIGVADLMSLYPEQRNRWPFVEAGLVEDGSYWGPGFGELLESIEDETTANHRLFTKAMRFSVGPLVFYRPGGAFSPESQEYDAFTAIPSENPGDVNPVYLKADLQGPVIKEQAVIGYGEKVTGVSDQTMGRSIDRPNAPRTASGQIALIEQGNVRASLDTRMLKESMRLILRHFWDLETSFGNENTFFRVTEEDAKGLFDVKGGGSVLTTAERAGRYDFSIRLGSSYWEREARKERQLTLYQLDLGNPLIATNPRALWLVTNKLHKEMGDPNFAEIIPEPPDLGMPKNPREEWVLILQGEEVEPNPMDNDDLHMIDHQRRIREEQMAPEPDISAIEAMIGHILQHRQQKQQKMLMQQLTQSLAQSIAANTANPQMGGLNALGVGQPAGLADVGNLIGELTGQAPGQTPGQSRTASGPPKKQTGAPK